MVELQMENLQKIESEYAFFMSSKLKWNIDFPQIIIRDSVQQNECDMQ